MNPPKRTMRKLAGFPTPGSVQRVGRGFEVYHQPTAATRQLWYYLRAVGKARVDRTFRYIREGRDGYLIHFMLRGQLWHRLREQMHVTNPGEACLLDLREPLSYGAAGSGGAEFYWVMFDGKDMPRVFFDLRADRQPIFAGLNLARTRQHFRELLRVTTEQAAAADVWMSSLLTGLLAELFSSRNQQLSFTAIAGHRRTFSEPVRKAVDQMTAFYDDQTLSIKELASHVGQSVSWFSRQFHREVGMSPRNFLNHYRVEQAKQQLETSNRSIAEIARSVGLPNQNYFARQFRRLVKVAPREFRRIHQPRPSLRQKRSESARGKTAAAKSPPAH